MDCQKPDREGGRFQDAERSQYHAREMVGLTLKQREEVECLIDPLTRVALTS